MSLYLPPQFGLPIRDGYGVDYDLALQRTQQHSGWVRQRRTWLLNPSLYSLTYRMPLNRANQMLAWLIGAGDQWLYIPTLTPDNNGPYDCTLLELRRTTPVSIVRIPLTPLVTLSFSAETRSTGITPAAPPAQWPAGFPLPQATQFTEEHGARNRTTYAWGFAVTNSRLREMLSFLQYVGTGWFRAPAINANVPCGWEFVRVTGNLAFSLDGPNRWQLTFGVETMPARWNTDATEPLPPWPPITGAGFVYDQPSTAYDEAGLVYDQT